MVFARPDSPVFLQGAFDLAARDGREPGVRRSRLQNRRPAVGWGEQAQCLFCATGRFYRPAYIFCRYGCRPSTAWSRS